MGGDFRRRGECSSAVQGAESNGYGELHDIG